MRLPGLIELGERDGVPVITIEQLIALPRRARPASSSRAARRAPPAREPARRGARSRPRTATFRFLAYKDRVTGTDHLAVVSGELGDDAPLVRVHSECLTGEAFGSLKCECGPQLDAALDAIEQDGGVVDLHARSRGPRHRAHQQAARVQPAGARARHGRRQPRARASGRCARLRRRRRHPRRPRHREGAPAHEQHRQGQPAARARPRRSSSRCRCWSASDRTTTSTSRPSATAWATSSPRKTSPTRSPRCTKEPAHERQGSARSSAKTDGPGPATS